MTRFASLATWLNWQEQLHPRPIDLGLDRVTQVYRKLGLHQQHPLTVTVAGTNGKGSCIAFLEAIYRAQGYKVGAYTSPHILKYNERIRVDGESVSDEAICQAFECIDVERDQTSLSYFEFGTLAALQIFAAAKVDVRLLEVGLGGRLDAVNIVDPDVALVTTIAIDHVDWLGNTLAAIGREKAGIFRRGVPAVIGDGQIPISVLETAQEKQALSRLIGRDFNYVKRHDNWDWQCAGQCWLNLPTPAFKGEHQYRNASAVLMAIQELQERLPVSEAALHSGLQNAYLKGRFQLIPGKIPVLLDVGHNPQAVQTLIEYLQTAYPAVKIHAVFAMMKDKDIASVVSIMHPYVQEWYLAPLQNPRVASEQVMLNHFHQQAINCVHTGFSDFSAAFLAARKQAQPDELILIFGSFFLVSEYLAKFP